MENHRDICVEGTQLQAGLIGFGSEPVLASSFLPHFAKFSAVTVPGKLALES